MKAIDNQEYDDSLDDELFDEFGDKSESQSLSDLDSELRSKDERLGMQAPEEEYIFETKEKKEKKKKIKKDKRKEISNQQTKRLIIAGIIIIVICFIVDITLIIYKNYHQDKIDINELLLYTDKPVVYDNQATLKKPTDKIPVINLNNSAINDINNEVALIYNNYYKSNPDYFRYDYSINKDTLSLLIIYRNKEETDTNYKYTFKTYNISLDTLSNLTENQILDKFKLNLVDVSKKMDEDFNKDYNELIRRNYIENNYDYNVLKDELGLFNITQNINYYIDNNKLYVYRNFDIYGNERTTSYFKEDNYKFYIK